MHAHLVARTARNEATSLRCKLVAAVLSQGPAMEKLQWIRQRTEFIAGVLEGFLAAAPAGEPVQCVLIGAGYDTRAPALLCGVRLAPRFDPNNSKQGVEQSNRNMHTLKYMRLKISLNPRSSVRLRPFKALNWPKKAL